jgi:cbb3-type cytochrome oxidase subunit 3
MREKICREKLLVHTIITTLHYSLLYNSITIFLHYFTFKTELFVMDWNLVVNSILTIFTAAMAIATGAMTYFTYKSIKENQKNREEDRKNALHDIEVERQDNRENLDYQLKKQLTRHNREKNSL